MATDPLALEARAAAQREAAALAVTPPFDQAVRAELSRLVAAILRRAHPALTASSALLHAEAAVDHLAAAATVDTSAPAPGEAFAPNAITGWTAMSTALGRTLPGDLAHSANLGRATLRRVAGRR